MPTQLAGYEDNSSAKGSSLRESTVSATAGSKTALDVIRIDFALTTKKSKDANNRLEYLGEAAPGTPTTGSAWRIQKRSYDAQGFHTDIKWAGSGAFNQAWDARTGLTYN